jgi:hypothetical protein
MTSQDRARMARALLFLARRRHGVIIKIVPNERGIPQSKLADAEIIFEEGVLTGLKLIGFGIWEGREGRHITFPARPFFSNGERRTYCILRPVAESSAQEPLRRLVLQAFIDYEHQAAALLATPLDTTGPTTVDTSELPEASDVGSNDSIPGPVAASVARDNGLLEKQA